MARPLFDFGIAHAGRECLHLSCSCHVEWTHGGRWLRTAGFHCEAHNPKPGRSAAAFDADPLVSA